MSVVTFPAALGASVATWGQQRRDAAYTSLFGSQAVETSPPLWIVTLTAPVMNEIDPANISGQWQAYVLSLKGRTNQAEVWNLGRPAPLGTMRGTMILNGAHALGAVALNISAAGQAGTTLRAGDLLGLGSGITQQVVMVAADATADGVGNITVSIVNPLRNAFANASAVAWDKPKALFRQTQSAGSVTYGEGRVVSGMVLDLIEDWRP